MLPVKELRKVGLGSAWESNLISRRTEIRTWSRDDVRRNLEGPLRNVTVLLREVDKRGERLVRVSLAEALHRHKIDGNALLDLREDDLMQWIGVCEIGVAKTLLRTIESLASTQSTAVRRPTSAPLSRNTIRYSSLDPFDGWDSHEQLHPKRNRAFKISVRPLRPSVEAVEVESMSTGCQTTEETPVYLVEKECSAQPQRDPEMKCTVNTEFYLGPLEKERRLAESRSMFDVLRSAESNLTLGWFLESAFECLDVEASKFDGTLMKCYGDIAAARSAKVSRPWSANRTSSTCVKIPLQDTASSARNLRLTRADFIVAVEEFCNKLEPPQFDKLFRFFSQKFGSEHMEINRRNKVLENLFRSLTEVNHGTLSMLLAVAAGEAPHESGSSASGALSCREFCNSFEKTMNGVTSKEFDQRMLRVELAAATLRQKCSKKQKATVSEESLTKTIQLSAPDKMVLLLSSSFNPTSLMERLFHSLRDNNCDLIAPRQRHLTVFAVGGDESIESTSFIESAGIERGQWILVTCAASVQNLLLNRLLRKLACMISCRPSMSFSPQFRLFVHCPVETVDLQWIPQIAQSCSVVVPLVR